MLGSVVRRSPNACPPCADVRSSCATAIAVVGETPYAEGAGDRPGSMSLDSTDFATINTLRGAGVPVVVVLVSGRPLDIATQLPNWNALVAAWLPGTEGQGVADILFGVAQPTGKLPMSWMSSVSQQPINDGDGQQPLFPFGFGLGYGPPIRDAYATIEAESFSSQSGVQLEATTDTGGGQDVGFIAPGDSIAYAGGWQSWGSVTTQPVVHRDRRTHGVRHVHRLGWRVRQPQLVPVRSLSSEYRYLAGGRSECPVTLHGIRHSFHDLARQQGVPDAVVRAMAGRLGAEGCTAWVGQAPVLPLPECARGAV